MSEFLSILVCALAVFGLYALFSRVAVMLLPHGTLFLTIDGRTLTHDEIVCLIKHARFLWEREHRLSRRVLVLLHETEREKMMSLRKEGILVYTVKEVTEDDGK